MKINQIIVLKETREGEGRVALTPTAVAALTAKQYCIMVERQAGQLAGFTDEEYIQAGATFFDLGASKFPPHSFIIRVKRPISTRESIENQSFSTDTVMMGFLDPFDVDHERHMARWQALGITLVSLELLNVTADDPRNAQAAMSRFAGRLALHNALKQYRGRLPKKVTVFGTGPAGLSAAFAARDLQLPVQLLGRQERYRAMVEAAGIVYHVLPTTHTRTFIREYLHHETIVIAAARSVGERSPLLIDATHLATLPERAVIVDLSTGEGGNVIGSREDQSVIVERGISIINVSGYPKTEPKAASEAFAQCMVNLLVEMVSPVGAFHLEDSLLKTL